MTKEKGAIATGYGITASLIAAVVIMALVALGLTNRGIFSGLSDSIEGVSNSFAELYNRGADITRRVMQVDTLQDGFRKMIEEYRMNIDISEMEAAMYDYSEDGPFAENFKFVGITYDGPYSDESYVSGNPPQYHNTFGGDFFQIGEIIYVANPFLGLVYSSSGEIISMSDFYENAYTPSEAESMITSSYNGPRITSNGQLFDPNTGETTSDINSVITYNVHGYY